MRHFCRIAAFVLTFTAGTTSAETYRVSCQHVVGSRITYFDNLAAPADKNRQVITGKDSITGGRLDITFDTEQSEASLVISGNVNTAGRVTSTRLSKFASNQFLSFIGIDQDNGAFYLLSYFPIVQKVIWSVHNDRILSVDRGAVGKQFMADCHTEMLE